MNSKKSKKKAPKPKKNATRKSTNSTNSTRQYPELSLEKETAVLLTSQGYTTREIGKTLGMDYSTISMWLKEPLCAAALDKEKTRIHEEIRARFVGVLDNAEQTLKMFFAQRIKTKKISSLDAKVAMAILKETGHLPTTDEKKERDRKVAQLAEQFLGEIREYASRE